MEFLLAFALMESAVLVAGYYPDSDYYASHDLEHVAFPSFRMHPDPDCAHCNKTAEYIVQQIGNMIKTCEIKNYFEIFDEKVNEDVLCENNFVAQGYCKDVGGEMVRMENWMDKQVLLENLCRDKTYWVNTAESRDREMLEWEGFEQWFDSRFLDDWSGVYSELGERLMCGYLKYEKNETHENWKVLISGCVQNHHTVICQSRGVNRTTGNFTFPVTEPTTSRSIRSTRISTTEQPTKKSKTTTTTEPTTTTTTEEPVIPGNKGIKDFTYPKEECWSPDNQDMASCINAACDWVWTGYVYQCQPFFRDCDPNIRHHLTGCRRSNVFYLDGYVSNPGLPGICYNNITEDEGECDIKSVPYAVNFAGEEEVDIRGVQYERMTDAVYMDPDQISREVDPANQMCPDGILSVHKTDQNIYLTQITATERLIFWTRCIYFNAKLPEFGVYELALKFAETQYLSGPPNRHFKIEIGSIKNSNFLVMDYRFNVRRYVSACRGMELIVELRYTSDYSLTGNNLPSVRLATDGIMDVRVCYGGEARTQANNPLYLISAMSVHQL